MELQDILSRRVDDLRADVATHVATIRQRLDTNDRRLEALERRVERPTSPLGGQTEWGWWLTLLITVAGWLAITIIVHAAVHAARSC